MKTKAITRAIKFTMLVTLAVFTQSCETEIPSEDLTPPEFSFQIVGAGINHTFDQDFDFENYYLRIKPDETYNIIFTGTDSGGVQNISWTFTNDGCLSVDETVTSPWAKIRHGGRTSIVWEGDRSNPLTGGVFSGDLRAGPGCINTHTFFDFDISDFGGPNTVSKRLQVFRSRGGYGVRRIFGG